MKEPVLLSSDRARLAFENFVMPGILSAMDALLTTRRHLHVVVLNPAVPYTEGGDLPILMEYSIGDPDEWEHWDGSSFDHFARGKALITWRTGLPSRVVIQTRPELLLPGDVKFWGSDIVGGFITGVSGVKPYHDEMWARQTSAALAATASENAALLAGSDDESCFF